MKVLSILMVVVVCFVAVLINAMPDDLETFQVAVTKTLYEGAAFQTNAPVVLCKLWNLPETEENKTWVMKGWKTNYMSIQNTNVQVYVYTVPTIQCRREQLANFSDAARSNITTKIANNPQIEAGFSRDPDGQLQIWGITNKPVVVP